MSVVLIGKLEIIRITLTLKDPKWFGCQNLRVKFIMHVCFTISNSKWYFDNGSSKHMTRDKSLFSTFTPKKEVFVLYCDNNKWRIIDLGTIDK